MDHFTFQAGAFYVMDRGYLDYGRLYTIHQSKAFFVARAKKNTRFRRRYSNEVDPTSTVRSDQIGVLDLENSFNRYPESLRRVSCYDPENDKCLVFLTNNLDVSAATVAELYRSRWQIELFFKWIKQRLGIDRPLYNILQVLSLTQFEKTPVFQVFSDEPNYNAEITPSHK